MPKLTIIDGNSLLFRAYFATAYPGVEIMRNQKGEPTNAIFAFSNMINKIVSSLKEGESLFVAFDAGKKNFRHDKLETYKANRKPAPEDLVKQFPMARELLKAFGIFPFEEVGYEGDDIAGTLAKKAASQGYNVTIYTSDRDFLQLVDENITVNLIKKGLSDIAEMTPQLVEETYHIKPIQIIDYKGLRGDSSDNLPGIPGIGDVTAVKLINKYGSFDEIIAHVDEIPGKVGEEIKNNIELGTISRDLAIIDINSIDKLRDNPNVISLSEYENSYICSVLDFNYLYIMTYADISTGSLNSLTIPHDKNTLVNEILKLNIKEILLLDNSDIELVNLLKYTYGIEVSFSKEYLEEGYEELLNSASDIRNKTGLKHLLYYLTHINLLIQLFGIFYQVKDELNT